ncbi:NEOXANTHIN-DEFICIENT 1 [Seminavis robusta]|uniref:NEOXANTHIN-DEFICIENT 1 n=1 Tax=Seminavis robusta TaxID=568900 RepID=A0A9N8DTJ3_9STRA|nr:NEOXANTHIN-DEFICIENT 1 [Seminavis robusta]|eukprot:Sro341_g121440.1 NEOXANTHIN-DEFICIENT 1 (328) ;mRNA; r:34714-35697
MMFASVNKRNDASLIMRSTLVLLILLSAGSSFSLVQSFPTTAKTIYQYNQAALGRHRHSSLSASKSSEAPPLPPWKFQASRIYYQFRAIPTKNARQYCPPCQGNASPLILLSLGGYTLGGIFCIEYQESPIGSYREVAFLSSLVARPPFIGAWASHIIVDSEEAAKYGQEFWGLPATVLPINFIADSSSEESTKISNQHGSILLSDNVIQVSGWGTTVPNNNDRTTNTIPKLILEKLDVSLPSFSGLLPVDNNEAAASKPSPLLQYPLSIEKPSSLGLDRSKSLQFGDVADSSMLHEVQSLLQGSHPLASVGVENVTLVAGDPDVVD